MSESSNARKGSIVQRFSAVFVFFLGQRFSNERFTGLPLTILFVFVLAALFGIIQDYLSHGPLFALDIRLSNLLYSLRRSDLLLFFYGVTLLAEASVIIVSALVFTLVLWFKRQRILVLGVWLSLMASEIITSALKLQFHRDRPVYRVITEDTFSFPSGHATIAVAFYGFIAYLFLRQLKSRKAKVLLMSGFIFLVILIDSSRLYLDVHFLSDVLAGNMIGFFGLIVSIVVVECFEVFMTLSNQKDQKVISKT